MWSMTSVSTCALLGCNRSPSACTAVITDGPDSARVCLTMSRRHTREQDRARKTIRTTLRRYAFFSPYVAYYMW